MTCYVAFLRGINVAGQKKVPMADLREVFVGLGGKHVKSYIQSGNVVFGHKSTSISNLENSLADAIKRAFNFEVCIVVKAAGQLRKIIKQNPFHQEAELASGKLYFAFLASIPEKHLVLALEQEVYEGESFFIEDDCVYLICHNGMGKARLNNNMLEQRLGVSATTRNYRTVTKVMVLCDHHISAGRENSI